MRRDKLAVALLLTLTLAAMPATVRAQDHYTYTVSLLGGVGGSLDEDVTGFGNQAIELGFSLLREDRVHVAFRAGEMEFEELDRVGRLFDSSLAYAIGGGEYRFLEDFYESGIFAGIGLYEFEGTDIFGRDDSESSVGLALGLLGEVEINRRVGVLVEFTGHLTNLESAESFVTGHAGLSVHF